ncbi:MAG TPA: hypothetical protein VEG68_11565 [Terriglobales bacterium]|nr:hypothetical protein [Terriglobales bacterium]
MAIEKKSLIKNRAATKKAVVAAAKPEITNKTGVTRVRHVGRTMISGKPHGRTMLHGKFFARLTPGKV